jgi:hypothetical protein
MIHCGLMARRPPLTLTNHNSKTDFLSYPGFANTGCPSQSMTTSRGLSSLGPRIYTLHPFRIMSSFDPAQPCCFELLPCQETTAKIVAPLAWFTVWAFAYDSCWQPTAAPSVVLLRPACLGKLRPCSSIWMPLLSPHHHRPQRMPMASNQIAQQLTLLNSQPRMSLLGQEYQLQRHSLVALALAHLPGTLARQQLIWQTIQSGSARSINPVSHFEWRSAKSHISERQSVRRSITW